MLFLINNTVFTRDRENRIYKDINAISFYPLVVSKLKNELQMKFKLIILLLFGITLNGFGQNLNMVIEVNERLVTTEIAGAYLNFEKEDGTKSRNLVGYHPGELVLQTDDWEKINSESTKKITLTFDYNTFKGNGHQIENFGIEMKKHHFDKRYLILRVYDFRERKFRKRYGCLTDEEFIAELNFPQGGILVRCR